MPRGDGTGPAGQGPLTGRGAGYCGGYDLPGYANPIPRYGRGMGWGGAWGRGRGWRYGYHRTGLPGWARFACAPAWGAPAWGAPPAAYGPYAAPPSREQEVELLQTQAEWLKQELDAIAKRIAELEQEA
jgi:hypothetical protein